MCNNYVGYHNKLYGLFLLLNRNDLACFNLYDGLVFPHKDTFNVSQIANFKFKI